MVSAYGRCSNAVKKKNIMSLLDVNRDTLGGGGGDAAGMRRNLWCHRDSHPRSGGMKLKPQKLYSSTTLITSTQKNLSDNVQAASRYWTPAMPTPPAVHTSPKPPNCVANIKKKNGRGIIFHL